MQWSDLANLPSGAAAIEAKADFPIRDDEVGRPNSVTQSEVSESVAYPLYERGGEPGLLTLLTLNSQ